MKTANFLLLTHTPLGLASRVSVSGSYLGALGSQAAYSYYSGELLRR